MGNQSWHSKKIPSWNRKGRIRSARVLLRFLFVSLFKFIDTAGGIDQHILAGKKRVGRIGNFKLHQGIFVAVFPLDRFAGIGGRTGKEAGSVTHVFENDEAIIVRMNILFHKIAFAVPGIVWHEWPANVGLISHIIKL